MRRDHANLPLDLEPVANDRSEVVEHFRQISARFALGENSRDEEPRIDGRNAIRKRAQRLWDYARRKLEQPAGLAATARESVEAALARELELDYACIALVANWAAGCGDEAEISLPEIFANLEAATAMVPRIVIALLGA